MHPKTPVQSALFWKYTVAVPPTYTLPPRCATSRKSVLNTEVYTAKVQCSGLKFPIFGVNWYFIGKIGRVVVFSIFSWSQHTHHESALVFNTHTLTHFTHFFKIRRFCPKKCSNWQKNTNLQILNSLKRVIL